ncbi:MAG: glycosyltransferase family 2 protein [Bacteroidales bacterium]
MKTKILAIVVTYNGNRWIRQCLKSLLESEIAVDCIVVDNDSTDDTREIVETEFPQYEMVWSRKNLGFGQANNIGLRKALREKYDYALLLNQDAYVMPDTLGKLLAAAQKEAVGGIFSPVHLDGTQKDLDYSFKVYASACSLAHFTEKYTKDASICTDFVNAAIWFVPISVVRTVGGFNPIFYHYSEDKDFCNRLLYHGFKIRIIPDAFAVHARTIPTKEEKTKIFHRRIYHLPNSWRVRLMDPAYAFLFTFIWIHGALAKEWLLSFVKKDIEGITRFPIIMTDFWKDFFRCYRYRQNALKIQPTFLNDYETNTD